MTAPTHLDQPSGDSALAVVATAVLAILIPFLLLMGARTPEPIPAGVTTPSVSSTYSSTYEIEVGP